MILKRVKNLVRKLFHSFGYYIANLKGISYLEVLMYGYLQNQNKIFFIQIGANDGVSTDPIYNFVTLNSSSVEGIALEPMPDVFEILKKNYKRYSNVRLCNLAIHNSKSEMDLYKVNPKFSKDLPKWTKGIASFNKKHHELSGIDSKFIISEKVKCISFDMLIEKYNIKHVDLLQIDTEGYDSEIIFSIDFSKIKPSIIHFEHGLRDGVMDKDTFLKVKSLLHANGYGIIVELYDVIAYQEDLLVDKNLFG